MKKKMGLFNQRGFRLFLMASPLLLLVFVFSYMPLYGWIYAFLIINRAGRFWIASLWGCRILQEWYQINMRWKN